MAARSITGKLLAGLLCLIAFSLQQLHAQVKVNVEIDGINQQLEQNVRLFLSIEQQKDSELLSQGRLQRLHKKALQEIRKALEPFGYYRVKVTNSILEKDKGGSWRASYSIDAGQSIPVGILDFQLDETIQSDSAFQALLEGISLKPGAPFQHAEYERIKSELVRLASERGYVAARFTRHQVEIDLQHYQANVYLHFEAGQRYKFGNISFSQVVLDEDLLHRFLPFKEGDPFHMDKLIEMQQALNDSDYFSTVEVSPGDADVEKLQVPVSIHLTARKRHRLSLGLGYGSDTGARAKFGWQIPRYNKQGHRIDTQASISQLGYSLSTQYTVPILNPRTDQLIYSAAQVNEKTDSSESTLKTLGISLNRKRGQWRESLSVNYQQEDFTIADTSDQATLLIPGSHWSRVWGREFWGNKLLGFFEGIRLDLGVRLGSTQLLSDVDFTQFTGAIKSINRLGGAHRIISRGRIGYTNTHDFEQLPATVRFFAGGAQSVRGYSYESLGPVDTDGDVVGGAYLLEGSIEYEYSINARWGVALFLDAGNAMNDLSNDLERGAGFGLRWNSPIGAVRFDLANAISSDDKPWRLHINIGPDL